MTPPFPSDRYPDRSISPPQYVCYVQYTVCSLGTVLHCIQLHCLDLWSYTLPDNETNAGAYEFIDSLVYMGAPRRLFNWGDHPENSPTNSPCPILLIVTEYSEWKNSCAGFEVLEAILLDLTIRF